jgi:hypothetical protein
VPEVVRSSLCLPSVPDNIPWNYHWSTDLYLQRSLTFAHWRVKAELTSNSAQMGDEKAQRLDDALSSLVDTLIPIQHGEDAITADERHEDALDLARSIIEGFAILRCLLNAC